jgi:hypothetical protein
MLELELIPDMAAIGPREAETGTIASSGSHRRHIGAKPIDEVLAHAPKRSSDSTYPSDARPYLPPKPKSQRIPPAMSTDPKPHRRSAEEILAEEFLQARSRILDLAAFLDRLERAPGSTEQRATNAIAGRWIRDSVR